MSLTAKQIPQDVREAVVASTNGYCGVEDCYENGSDWENPIDVHHRCENSINNNAQYPILMQSPFMLIPLCRKHHLDGKVLKSLSYTYKQMRMMENFLQGLVDK